MPNLARSPPLSKSHSVSDSDVDKITSYVSPTEEFSHITQRDTKRRRITLEQSESEFSNIRTILREELQEVLSTLQGQQNSRLDVLEKYITEIKTQNVVIQKKNLDIEQSIEFATAKLDEVQSTIANLEKDRQQLVTQISQIEEKCDAMERIARKYSIQIRNVPKQENEPKEKIFDMIKKLTYYLGVNMDTTELRDVYRLPTKPGQTTTSVIVEFSSTLLKGHVLMAAKKQNLESRRYKTEQLNSSHLGLDGPKTEIYLAEHLTPQASRLYYLARELRKSMGYDYCWTRNGLVYIRKKEGEPHILIKSEAQLQQLRNK